MDCTASAPLSQGFPLGLARGRTRQSRQWEEGEAGLIIPLFALCWAVAWQQLLPSTEGHRP